MGQKAAGCSLEEIKKLVSPFFLHPFREVAKIGNPSRAPAWRRTRSAGWSDRKGSGEGPDDYQRPQLRLM